MTVTDRPRFRVVQGDITWDRGIPLIPVNCVPGVMGKGLAKRFADLYPGLKKRHHDTLKTMGMRIGSPVMCFLIADKPLILFPTKDHWRNPSEMRYIFVGLANLYGILARHEPEAPVIDLAVPALGCGLGGLPFDLVGPVISAWAFGLPERYHVTLYRPHEGD